MGLAPGWGHKDAGHELATSALRMRYSFCNSNAAAN